MSNTATASTPSRPTALTSLVERNREFAADYAGGLPLPPRLNTLVLTCADARVDPAHFLGLELGDAAIMRTLGGRVTGEVEQELAVLGAFGKLLAPAGGMQMHLAIIQHTDCGVERFANPELRAKLSRASGVEEATLEKLAVSDHDHSLAGDIERLRGSALVPRGLIVSGHVYDVDTGVVREVVPPAPLE